MAETAKPGTLVASAVPQVSAPMSASAIYMRGPRALRPKTGPYTKAPSTLHSAVCRACAARALATHYSGAYPAACRRYGL